MIELKGSAMMIEDNSVIVVLIDTGGSVLFKGFNPCLEIEFEDKCKAQEWFSKIIRIKLEEDDLIDTNIVNRKLIEFNKCTLEEVI